MGLFDFLERKKTRPLTACVLTRGPARIDVVSLVQALRGGQRDVVRRGDASDRSTVVLDVGKVGVVVRAVQERYPEQELGGLLATAWWWPDGANACKEHQALLAIGVLDGDDAMQRHLLLTQTLAATLDDAAIAVIGPANGAIASASLYREIAASASAERPPTPLWVSVRFARLHSGESFAFTTGLEAFGKLEIEADLRDDEARMGPYLFDVASYVLTNERAVRDGDTVGPSDDERFRVQTEKSRLPGRGKVLRLRA